MSLSPWIPVVLAVPVLLLGEWIVRRVSFLARFNIPAPVVGGLLVSLVVLAGNLTGVWPAQFETKVAAPWWTWIVTIEPEWAKAPAKAAAKQMIVHLDLFKREAGDLRGGGLRPAHDLYTDPNIAAVLGDVHRAIHRLHGGMSQERHLVDGIDFLGGARYGLGKVAVASGGHAFVLRGALHLLNDALRRDVRVRSVVPLDVEG